MEVLEYMHRHDDTFQKWRLNYNVSDLVNKRKTVLYAIIRRKNG